MTVSGDKKTGNTAKQDLYDDLDKEWRRMLRDRMRKEKEKEKRRERLAEEEMSLLPNVKYSTAETRPNAYISTADSRSQNKWSPGSLQTLQASISASQKSNQ